MTTQIARCLCGHIFTDDALTAHDYHQAAGGLMSLSCDCGETVQIEVCPGCASPHWNGERCIEPECNRRVDCAGGCLEVNFQRNFQLCDCDREGAYICGRDCEMCEKCREERERLDEEDAVITGWENWQDVLEGRHADRWERDF